MSGVQPALDALARGEVIIITGDRFRRGDMDFCVAAHHASADAINFLATHGRPLGRSIEAAEGVTTGISAADRAQTVKVAIQPDATSEHIVSPGHVFPLITAPGGVRERAAAAEAAVDLCQRAGVGDAAVICAIMRDDGEMARPADIADLVARFGLAVANIDDLLEIAEPGAQR